MRTVSFLCRNHDWLSEHVWKQLHGSGSSLPFTLGNVTVTYLLPCNKLSHNLES